MAPTPTLIVREQNGRVFYEATWRHYGKVVKRRVGEAWLEPGSHEPRRGRLPEGYFDEPRAHVRAAAFVGEHTAKMEAEAAERERPTFRTVARSYLDWMVTQGKPSTLRDHRSVLSEPDVDYKRGDAKTNGYVLRALGDKPAADVATRDIEAVLKAVEKGGAGPRTVNKYRSVVSAVYSYGTKESTFALPSNPVREADKRRAPGPKPLDYYTPEQVEACADAAGGQDGELIRVAAFTGMRQGEILALRWKDVDLRKRQITVSRAMSAGDETSTKSDKIRQVPLSAQAAGALERLRERGDFTDANDRVFCSAFGERLDGSAVTRRYKAARDAAGLEPLKFHELRHTFGSLCAEKGIDLITIKAFMGHVDVATTQRYLHARPATTMADRLTEVFEPAT